MAADREWFCIEKPNGTRLGQTEGYPNREAANTAARALAEESKTPLTVVRYTRREVRTFTRNIVIAEADVGTVSPA